MNALLTSEEKKILMSAARFILANRKKLQEAEVADMINEDDACKLLGITRNTLSNYMRNGKITPDMYTIGVGGNKFFYKQKLMNANQHG
jgi:hypothetical protein